MAAVAGLENLRPAPVAEKAPEPATADDDAAWRPQVDADMIEPFLEEVGEHENADRVGVVVDVRTHDFANIFPTFYRDRIQKLVPHVVLIFLEASDEVLARRYSETRRPHPLARPRRLGESRCRRRIR